MGTDCEADGCISLEGGVGMQSNGSSQIPVSSLAVLGSDGVSVP